MAESLSRGQLPERTLHPYAMAAASESYIDDTAPQPVIEVEPAHTEHRIVRRLPTPLVTTLPPSTDSVPLSPLVEQASQSSLSNSSASLNIHPDQHTGLGSSHVASRSPRLSSILDPNPPTTSQPMRLSNSWWARFAKPSLLERRSTELSAWNSSGFIDLRLNPNPPRRMVTEFTYSRLSDTPLAVAHLVSVLSPFP
jgi:hypothetical protein